MRAHGCVLFHLYAFGVVEQQETSCSLCLQIRLNSPIVLSLSYLEVAMGSLDEVAEQRPH